MVALLWSGCREFRKEFETLITLDVAPYGNYCSKFVPVASTSCIKNDYGEKVLVKTMVRCEHAEQCRSIEKFLNDQFGAGGSFK